MIEFLTNNWLYLAIAGFMIFSMVKGGGCCGGHSVSDNTQDGHSHGGGCCGGDSNSSLTQDQDTTGFTARDPICGMEVDQNTALSYTLNGETYYFCSEACKSEFIKKH